MKLIDAEKIPWQTTKTIDDDPIEVILVFKQDIDIMPAVEIIRCKECIYKQESCCTKFAEVWITDNDFCSRAERKTE